MDCKIKIALLQIAPGPTLAENVDKGIACCRKASKAGADIAVFPEMWSNGYGIHGRPADEWLAEALPVDGEYVAAFEDAARSLNMAIGVTLLERHCDGARNSVILVDRFGERKFVYAKVHTCDFDAERALARGDDFHVATLDVAAGNVEVGAMICYDREFPESARILMLKGAELVIVPNACPMDINRLSQLRARAYENMMAIATCNYPDTVPDCDGHSSVFDGMAFLPDVEAPRDMRILLADGREGVCVAELDLGRLREYRRTEVHGNSYRRPNRYGLLTNPDVRPPFVRDDRRP